MNIKKIKENAREIIRENLWQILKPYLLVQIISLIISLIIKTDIKDPAMINLSNVLVQALTIPLSIGYTSYVLKFARKQEVDKNEIFRFYKTPLYPIALFMIISLFISLWSLLFIIPGIIASINYVMAPYIMCDKIQDPLKCITESKLLIYGYKWDYCKFILSFIGWALISIFAFWYVIPYISISEALYYEELKKVFKMN